MQNNDMQQRRKKLSIRIGHWYRLSMYAGLLLVSLCYPQLPLTVTLWPGQTGHRAYVMIIVLVLMGADMMLDRLYMRAFLRDKQELAAHVKNGGMHVQLLQAAAAPIMLILDALAVIYLYQLMPVEHQSVLNRTVSMAAGCVLWIYARTLPYIPYQSIWGIRTKASLADVQSWGFVHLRAMPWVELSGIFALICATFLPETAALVCAAAACVAAFCGMFLTKAKK